MRLIDADELYKYCDVEETKDGLYIKRANILTPDFIKSLPSVDAVPVVHGRWIDGTCGCYKICSNCDQISDFDFDYCPNCGADMRGKQHDD